MLSLLTRSLVATQLIEPYRIVAFSDPADGRKVATAIGALAPIAGTTGKLGSPSGDMADVIVTGLGDVQLGGAVAPGDPLTANSVGKAVKATASGSRIVGYAEDAGVADDIISYRTSLGVLGGSGDSGATIHNLSAAYLRRWAVARGKALAMSSVATIALIGDSTMGLVGSSTAANGTDGGQPTSLAAQMVPLINGRAGRSNLARSQGFWGTHFSSGTASQIWAMFKAFDTRFTDAVSSGGGVQADNIVAGGGTSISVGATGTGRVLTFTPSDGLPYDRVRIVYGRGGGWGQLTVSGAGGGSQQISTAGSTTNVEATVALTRGTGPLTIAFQDNAYAKIIAFEIWDSTIGQIIVRDMSFSGSTTATYGKSASGMPLLASDFALYCFGLNDSAAGKAPATYGAELATLIAGYSPAGSVALTVPNESSTTWQGIAGIVDNQRAIAAQIRSMGRDAGYPVIDVPARTGDYATGNANGFYFNDPHPSAAGYADRAVAATQVLWA